MKIVRAKILTEDHTHENRPVAKGDVIEVPEDIGRILSDAKIAKIESATVPEGA